MRVPIEELDEARLNELIDKGERFEVYIQAESESEDMWLREDGFWEDDD
jgi:hypothetical protein